MYEYLNYRNDPFEAERDFAREEAAEARYLAEIHADQVETGCTPEEIAAPHPLIDLPVIERKPLQLSYTAQGNLFDEEVA